MLLTRKPNLGCVKVPSWDILGGFFARSLHQASLLQPLMFRWCPVDGSFMFQWRSIEVPTMFHWCYIIYLSCSIAVTLMFQWRSIDVPLTTNKNESPPNGNRPSDDLRIGTCVAGRPEYSVPVPDHQQRLGDKSATILGDFHMIFIWFPTLTQNQMQKMIKHEKHMINNWFWRPKRPLA